MKARGLVWIAAAATVLAWATPTEAASAKSVTVAPSSPSAGWSGKSFLLGKTASPGLCSPSIDPLGLLCDHETVVVDVSSSYWDAHSGSVRITIGWSSSSDDFDLYVYNSSGQLAGSSASKGSTGEGVTVSKPSGSYEARVVPVSVTSSAASGSANFSSSFGPGALRHRVRGTTGDH